MLKRPGNYVMILLARQVEAMTFLSLPQITERLFQWYLAPTDPNL